MKTCENCHHFKTFKADVFGSHHGSRNYSHEELAKGKYCHREKEALFLTVPSSVCALHESSLEYKYFFWLKWLFPWFFLLKARKLAKRSLALEATLRDNGHVLRAALKCAFSGLTELFKHFKEVPLLKKKAFASPTDRILLTTLDNLGTVAQEPALTGLITDLKIKNPEEGKFYA